MPTTFSSNAIYLGRYGSIDTNEANFSNESYNPIPAQQNDLQFAQMRYFDQNDDGAIRSNDNGQAAETISFNLGGGEFFTQIDAEFRADVRLNYEDGTTYTGNWYFIQTLEGDVFMLPDPSGTDPADDAALEAKPIASMTLLQPTRGDYAVTIADRSTVSPAVCFGVDTLIETPSGPRRAGDIVEGDIVTTLDRGPVRVRYRARFARSRNLMQNEKKARPVRIEAGALGRDLPHIPLLVTRHHRILVDSPVVRHAVGSNSVLVPAKHFLELDGVDIVVPQSGLEFVHFCCDHHEIIRANGVWAETMYLGVESRKVLGLTNATVSKPARQLCDDGRGKSLMKRINARARRHQLDCLLA